MWKDSYGKEPFDLRLMALRLVRNLNKIFVLTLLGTLVLGGAYYVKNVLLRPAREYSVTATYKLEYVTPPVQSGDYYINMATWDTLVDTGEFLEGVEKHLQEAAAANSVSVPAVTRQEMIEAISATLPTDWHVPTTTVVTENAELTELLAEAVALTMTEEVVTMMKQELVSSVVIDDGLPATEVPLDVRPARAFVLSAVISCFFATVAYMLREIGADSIWLPATLRRRYGLQTVGTLESVALAENIRFLFAGKGRVAVCPVDAETDPAEVLTQLRDKLSACDMDMVKGMEQWIPLPSPVLCPEVCGCLREAEGMLLVVKADLHAGKPLEYVLELLKTQQCEITAVILWDADELLLKTYYLLPEVCS